MTFYYKYSRILFLTFNPIQQNSKLKSVTSSCRNLYNVSSVLINVVYPLRLFCKWQHVNVYAIGSSKARTSPNSANKIPFTRVSVPPNSMAF